MRFFLPYSMQKDLRSRPKFDRLISHEFITKYGDSEVDVAGFVQKILDGET